MGRGDDRALGLEQGALSDLEHLWTPPGKERFRVRREGREDSGLSKAQQGRLCEIRKQGLGLWLRVVPSKGEDLI